MKPEVREAMLDREAVVRASLALKEKLNRKRAHYPGNQWLTTDPAKLSQMLREQVEKGDPIDVMAFCAFLHFRGERIK